MSTSPAVIAHLSGATVQVDASSVTVSRLARTSIKDNGPVSANVADVAVSVREPGALSPGLLDLGPSLPSVRVTGSTREAASAIAELIGSAAEGRFADAATALLEKEIRGIGEDDEPAPAPTAPVELPSIDFIAFDVETANEDSGSIIQLGLAVVRAGEVAETYSWLCRPPKGLEQFDDFNISIHGIRPSDVAGAPSFAERLEEFEEVVGKHEVVAHNAKFDFTALQRAARADGLTAPEIDFACTYQWARAARVQTTNMKLNTLAAAAGHDLKAHHDAAADAVACAEVALWLMRGDAAHQFEATTSPSAYSADLGLDMGHIGGRRLRQVGPKRVSRWDAAKTPDTIPEANTDADPNNLLFEQNVTLTGDFAPYDKGQLWASIAELGGTVGKNVTKKTTILVAGPWDSVTSKEKKAREYMEKGQAIEIWTNTQLYDVLGLETTPPF